MTALLHETSVGVGVPPTMLTASAPVLPVCSVRLVGLIVTTAGAVTVIGTATERVVDASPGPVAVAVTVMHYPIIVNVFFFFIHN